MYYTDEIVMYNFLTEITNSLVTMNPSKYSSASGEREHTPKQQHQ